MGNRDHNLDLICRKMELSGLDAYIVPASDPHQSEYIPDHWKFREWISGFTGSAGVVVITRGFTGLWTDSRYFIQAEEQLHGCRIELVKLQVPHTPEYIGWLKESLSPGSKVGLDSRFFSVSMIRYMKDSLAETGIRLQTGVDLISEFWQDRPTLPAHPVFEHSIEFAGVSRVEKIRQVREQLELLNSDFQFIAPLDEIAWLFNLRGTDVRFCPVFVSFALIGLDNSWLFIDRSKITAELAQKLAADQITVAGYEQLEEVLQQLPEGSTAYLAAEKTSGSVFEILSNRAFIREGMNLTTGLKSIKNDTEISSLRKVMIKDGVAWSKALFWIYDRLKNGKILTEIAIADKIAELRSGQENYRGESFHPISSFGRHGSVVHYSVTKESSIELGSEGIFLLDSGGQFLDGTTDTTRTITLGRATATQKIDFTLALKGTLGVSMLRFPAGTRGYQIDVLARLALWEHGKNYGHGTGHGVGFFLNVHEGPQTIGTSAAGYLQTTLEPGMVTTVEPAFYLDGEYGMRTENMTLVVPDIQTVNGTFYRFETLTLVPIDRHLIATGLLTPSERRWIDDYHRMVYEKISPFLSNNEREWLEEATQPM